jgi:hypothetical protein
MAHSLYMHTYIQDTHTQTIYVRPLLYYLTSSFQFFQQKFYMIYYRRATVPMNLSLFDLIFVMIFGGQ